MTADTLSLESVIRAAIQVYEDLAEKRRIAYVKSDADEVSGILDEMKDDRLLKPSLSRQIRSQIMFLRTEGVLMSQYRLERHAGIVPLRILAHERLFFASLDTTTTTRPIILNAAYYALGHARGLRQQTTNRRTKKQHPAYVERPANRGHDM